MNHVVFVHSSDELYGADRIVLELVGMLPDGWRATVLLPTDLEHGPTPLCVELERRGHAVRHVDLPVLRRAYRTPKHLARLAGRLRSLSRELRTLRPDVVYCTTSATYLGVVSARRAKVPRVVGHVQELWSRSDAVILTPFAARCDALIAISDAVAGALPARLRPRCSTVVNATADPGPVEPLDGRGGPLIYLVASRWNGWKGHRTLLDAWQRAGGPGRLLVLGGPPASGEAVDVARLADELGIADSVEIVGEVPDPSPWLRRADVVVMPSDAPEPFGLIAIEAFARGRPVIASAAGGLAEIVTDGVDGWTFPPRDAAALAAVLGGLDRDTVTHAGTAARARYEDRFTVARYGEQWRRALLD